MMKIAGSTKNFPIWQPSRKKRLADKRYSDHSIYPENFFKSQFHTY